MSTGRPSVLDDRTVERLLAGRSGPADPELQRVVQLVRSMGSGPAPRPTAALAELLDTGFDPEIAPQRRPALRRRPWVVRTTAGLAAAAASLMVAGTAQALPAPLQDGLAGVVRALTPFELPDSHPTDDGSTDDGRRTTDDGSSTDGPGTGAGRQPAEPAPTPAPADPDGGGPGPASDARPGAGHGAIGGAGTTPGDGAAGRDPGSAVPTPGSGPPRPPAAAPRDEPGRAVPEGSSPRQEPGPPPAPSGSEGATGTATRPGTPDPATTDRAQPSPAAPEARGRDVEP